MLYSELQAKMVLNLDGALLGRVTGAFFQLDTNECTAIAAERGIFTVDDVYAVKDIITLKLGTVTGAIPSSETHMFLTASMQAYDCKGENLGKVTDFYIEPHNKKEDLLMTETESFPMRKLLFTEGDYAVVNKGDQLPRKRRAKECDQQNAVKPAPKTSHLPAPTGKGAAIASIETINFQNYGENRFLIGRTLTKTISDFDHNTIVPFGTVITTDVIESAKRQGKLSELTKYSK